MKTARHSRLGHRRCPVSVLLALPAGCKEQPKPQPPPPPKVTVAQPVQQAVTDYLELTGNTQAINTVQLVARVAGYLEKVFFQDGQHGQEGPAALPHPAEHVPGQPPAGRGRRPAAAGPAASTPKPS